MNNCFDIYEYFNSRDIAEHCRSINHSFSAIEAAYIVWRSNHHTLAQKHRAWQEIIHTMPDEHFYPSWDFDDHTLHSFLRTYMKLQNEFIEEFCTSTGNYIYTYATMDRFSDQYCPDCIFYDSYEACLNDLKANEFEDDPDDNIAKAKITRHTLYSSHTSFRDAKESESIVFDKQLQPLDMDLAQESDGEKRFLCPAYGFYEMWVAIPTPFHKGDIVADVEVYKNYSTKHLPFILDRIPYWRKNADNGDDCDEQMKRLLKLGADWTDMQECVYFQHDSGEIYWDHAFHYLDLEYYRDDLEGNEKFLVAVSNAMKGNISLEELLRSRSIILAGEHAAEQRKYFGDNLALMRLCGFGAVSERPNEEENNESE